MNDAIEEPLKVAVTTLAGGPGYGHLVIATGPEPDFDEIEGFGPTANTQSVCQVDHALQALGIDKLKEIKLEKAD